MMKRFSWFLRPAALAAAIALLPFVGAAHVWAAETASPAVTFPFSGTIGATFEKNVYTYMQIDIAGGAPVWVISQLCNVKKGDKIDVEAGKSYPQVYNQETGVTFESLVVVTKLKVNGVEAKTFIAHDLPSGCYTGRPPAK